MLSVKSVLGIDPGANNGFAVFENGKLIDMHVVSVLNLALEIDELRPDLIVFEDSRLQSVTFSRGVNQSQLLKIARNVGMVDAVCSMICQIAELKKIPAHGISPRSKGPKLDSVEFSNFTGWIGKTNQHCRDAAMVAWPFRASL